MPHVSLLLRVATVAVALCILATPFPLHAKVRKAPAKHPASHASAAPAEHRWLVDKQALTVTRYSLSGNGALVQDPGSTLAVTFMPDSVASGPGGTSLYVADGPHGLIWQYAVDASGKATPLVPPNVLAKGVNQILVDTDNRRLFGLRYDGIVAYKVRDDGTLRPIESQPVQGDSDSVSFALSPNGQNIYVACDGRRIRKLRPEFPNGSVCQFTVSEAGAASQLDPLQVPAGIAPSSIAVAPSGRFAYAVASKSKSLHPFRVIDGGALAALDVDTIPLVGMPITCCVEPTGRFLYVACAGSGKASAPSIAIFRLGSDGAPAVLTTVAFRNYARKLFTDSHGRFLYAAGGAEENAAAFRIGEDGSLSLVKAAR